MKILIIEDEVALANSINQYLQDDGYLCEVVCDFEEAMIKSEIYEYDCILIDITLPGGSGLDIIRALRERHSRSGVIIISAKYSADDKIKGLEQGADDYLTKPFNLSELNARIKALVRRRQFNGVQKIEFHEISVNTGNHEVKVRNHNVSLTRSEYRLLLYFLANHRRVLSKEVIAEHLVGDDADTMDSFDFVYSHIKNLRRKLVKAGSRDYIHAIYGMGYKFSD